MRYWLGCTVLLMGLLFFTPSALAQQPTGTEGVGAFWSGGAITQGGLIPPCLRTANAAQTAGISCVEESIRYYTSILLFIIALGAFLYFLYGAFLYASAFGDENKVKQAKLVITNALIGIVLAVLSATIVAFVQGMLGYTP